MAHSFSIRGWEKTLQKFGYSKNPQARGVFSKPAGVRTLSIQKSHPRASTGQVTVNLDICQPYRDFMVVILRGSLRRTQPPLISIGGGDLWRPDEADAALAMTIEFGLPWLEHYAKPQPLIEYYESTLRNGIPLKKLKLPPIFKKISFGPASSETVRRPPIHNWYLAELYSELGNQESSRRFAETYLATLPNNKFYEQERADVMAFISRVSHA
jgi:hypothetical protein